MVTSWLEIRSLYLDTCLQVTSIFLGVIRYWLLWRPGDGINWDQTLYLFLLFFFLFALVMVEVALLNTQKEKVTAF